MKTIAAAFDHEQDARAAYAQLQDAGVPGDDIGLVLREHAGEYGRHEDFVEGANEWLGASAGAAVGGVGGWIAGAAAAGFCRNSTPSPSTQV